MNLEFYPGRQTGRGRQAGQPHGFGRIARAARVWEKEEEFRIDKLENICVGIGLAGKISASQGDRHDL
jgi:hypothetical protein